MSPPGLFRSKPPFVVKPKSAHGGRVPNKCMPPQQCALLHPTIQLGHQVSCCVLSTCAVVQQGGEYGSTYEPVGS